jgi:hypothetical protein
MAEIWDDEPTPEQQIAAKKKEMERIREADTLKKQGYPVKTSDRDSERLVTLSLEIKALQNKVDAERNEYYASHDL